MDIVRNPAEMHRSSYGRTHGHGENPAQVSSCTSPRSDPPRRGFLVWGGSPGGIGAGQASSPLHRANTLQPVLLLVFVPLSPFPNRNGFPRMDTEHPKPFRAGRRQLLPLCHRFAFKQLN